MRLRGCGLSLRQYQERKSATKLLLQVTALKSGTGARRAGHYRNHRWFVICISEVHLVSDQKLPPKKRSDYMNTDAGESSLPNALDEVSFLRVPDVKLATGLSKSSLYALIRAHSFPAPVRLGPRTVAWVKSEVNKWAADRIFMSRASDLHLGSKRTPQPVRRETWAGSKKLA